MKLLVFFIFPVIKKQGFQLRVRKGRGGLGGGVFEDRRCHFRVWDRKLTREMQKGRVESPPEI